MSVSVTASTSWARMTPIPSALHCDPEIYAQLEGMADAREREHDVVGIMAG